VIRFHLFYNPKGLEEGRNVFKNHAGADGESRTPDQPLTRCQSYQVPPKITISSSTTQADSRTIVLKSDRVDDSKCGCDYTKMHERSSRRHGKNRLRPSAALPFDG
jgi:hypothetical protein